MTPRDPTPEEIAEACREIREGWTLAEHYRRAGMEPPFWYRIHERGVVNGWTPPQVRCEVPGQT